MWFTTTAVLPGSVRSTEHTSRADLPAGSPILALESNYYRSTGVVSWVATCRGSNTWTARPLSISSLLFILFCGNLQRPHAERNLLPSNHDHPASWPSSCRICSMFSVLGPPVPAYTQVRCSCSRSLPNQKPADSQPGDRAFWKDLNRTPSRSKAGKRPKPAGRRASVG